MKLIFICSPFAGDMEGNIVRARKYARFAMEQGHIPFVPHLLFPQFLDDADPAERKQGVDMGLSVLGLCHELWSFGSEPSPGMAAEIDWAEKLNIPVRRWTDSDIQKTMKMEGN
jgi:hypothetical protein